MLTRAMELWHGLALAAVSLLLHACLLAATGYLLSRHIAWRSERMLREVMMQAQGSHPVHQPLPAAKETTETWTERSTPASVPLYRSESDTSSDSSDSSDGRDSSPPTCQVSKGVNYTQAVFSTPGGLSRECALDYENMKDTTDYVNVNPKSSKPNSWAFSNPAVSEPVEYTQVVI